METFAANRPQRPKDARRFVYEYLAMIRFLDLEMPFSYISLLALTIDNRDSFSFPRCWTYLFGRMQISRDLNAEFRRKMHAAIYRNM